MPGTKPIDTVQYALNNGEISYRYESRGDHPRYMQSVARAENWIPVIVGGMRFRDGLAFDVHTKNDGFVRLIPFIFNKYESYVVELGEGYARFLYKDGTPVMAGAVPLEIVLPYTLAEMLEIDYAESADIMYTFHINHKVQKILRIALDNFITNEVNFNAPGTVLDEPTGADLGIGTLTPGATSGLGVTFTGQNPGFVLADVTRGIRYLGSRALITAFISATQVTADIVDPFPSTSPIPATDWRLTGTPDGNIDVSRKRKHGITNIVFSVNGAVRSRDVGSYIRVWGGFIRIIEFLSPTNVKGLIVNELKELDPDASITIPNTEFWEIWRPAWTSQFGFPSCGTFGQNRFFLGRNLTMWGSMSADIENFALGSGDEDGINREVVDDEVNDLQWLAWIKRSLKAGTIGGEYEVSASTEGGPITPNDFNVNHITADGTAKIKPVRAKGKLLFVQFGGRRIRALNFNWLDNEIQSPDLLSLADHLTEAEFRQIHTIAYQHEPQSLVWCVLGDGTMIVMLIEPDEKIVAWARVDTKGCVISVTAIPNGDSGHDRVFIAVQRANGTFIEHFDSDRVFQSRPWKGFSTDSAVLRTATGDQITGLDHLEGQTVRVIGNGLLYDDAVVTSGAITVTPDPSADPTIEFEVGLAIENNELWMLEPPIPASMGGPASTRGWAKIGLRFRKSLGLKLGVRLREEQFQLLRQLEFRQADDPRFETPPLKRGKLSIPSRGHDSIGRIVIKQDLPYPAEVLSVYGQLSVGDQWKDEIFDDTEEAVSCVPAPPPPPLEECPPTATVAHVDSGFISIATALATLDKNTSIVYYASNGSVIDSSVPIGRAANILQSFDMNAPAVQYNTLGTGRNLRRPYVDSASRLWVQSWGGAGLGFSNQRIIELDPTSPTLATLNENTSVDVNMGEGEIRVGTTVLYVTNPNSGFLYIIDKVALTQVARLRPDLDFGTTGTQPKFQGGAVDGSGNFWVTVKTRNGTAANNRLMKISAAGALLEDFDLTAEYAGANVSLDLMFDPITDSLVITGDGQLKQWNIATDSVINTTSPFSFIDGATTRNGLSDSKFWYFNAPTANAFIEFDVAAWGISRTVLLADIVGVTTVFWANPIWMPLLGCLHVNHGAIGGGIVGGVDKICLPCPIPSTPVSRSSLLSQNLQRQQVQRGPSIVPSLP